MSVPREVLEAAGQLLTDLETQAAAEELNQPYVVIVADMAHRTAYGPTTAPEALHRQATLQKEFEGETGIEISIAPLFPFDE
jgi:hypothetical protein